MAGNFLTTYCIYVDLRSSPISSPVRPRSKDALGVTDNILDRSACLPACVRLHAPVLRSFVVIRASLPKSKRSLSFCFDRRTKTTKQRTSRTLTLQDTGCILQIKPAGNKSK